MIESLKFSGLIERYPALRGSESTIVNAINALLDVVNNRGTIWAFGNGGSCADAEHFCGELTKNFVSQRGLSDQETAALDSVNPQLKQFLRGGIAAIALSTQSSSISAFSNDVDYKYALAQMVWACCKPGDVVVGFSTSGNSENIVNALQAAKAKRIKTMALTGSKPNRCLEFCDITIQAPSTKTHEIQEFHLPIYHAICLEVEKCLWG